jgi:Methyltransferase domain
MACRRGNDVVPAVHMLYHVPDRETAVRELRRVLVSGGACVAVTIGARHTRSPLTNVSFRSGSPREIPDRRVPAPIDGTAIASGGSRLGACL